MVVGGCGCPQWALAVVAGGRRGTASVGVSETIAIGALELQLGVMCDVVERCLL